MTVPAMQPYGRALMDFLGGDVGAPLAIRRDDGLTDVLPVEAFFRARSGFSTLETIAVQRCRGPVLDVGAGAGGHSLALQHRGIRVTAIDISPHAVEVMVRRGVQRVYQADVFDFVGGPYATMLLLGRSVGMVESLSGLDRFLAHVRRMLAPDG